MTQTSRDWYRRTTWSADDSADFFARLKRARDKTQYLRLQALALHETGVEHLIQVALELLDLALASKPDSFHLSMLHLQRAECLIASSRAQEAIMAFRSSLQARRELPNVANMGYLEFAWAIARLRMKAHYDEVLAVLKEFGAQSDLVFPANAYRYFGALALIAADQGDRIAASRWAKDAIAASSESRGPFFRHPTFGVVESSARDEDAHERLWHYASL